MEKQIILFDIDSTLFDVDTYFTKNLNPALENELGISQASLEKIEKAYKDTLEKSTQFDPEGWIKEAKKQLGDKAKNIADYVYKADFFVNSLYPEVIPLLNNLKNDYLLGIYSEGNFEWQNKKIELSGIKNYFEHKYISISDDKVSDSVLEWIPQNSVIVDDREDFILELEKLDKVSPVWLNRKMKEVPPNTKAIKDLLGLMPMLARIRLESSPQS